MKWFLKAIMKRKVAFMALSFMVLLVICAVFSPLLTAYDPLRINPVVRLLPPSMEHILGTDSFGRDVFSRTIYGTRQTLITGASIVGFSVFFGVLIGAMSGYFRPLGSVLMRLMDILMSFPDIMLALALMAIFGRGLFNVIIA